MLAARRARRASRSRRCTAPCRCWRSRCSPSTSARRCSTRSRRSASLNAVVPFQTDYRPLWLGLGTVASDLLVALALTSLVRRRLGYRAWRGLHWLAYACWPVALRPRHRHRLRHPVDVDARAHGRLRAAPCWSRSRRGSPPRTAAARLRIGGDRGRACSPRSRSAVWLPLGPAGARLGAPRRDPRQRAGGVLAAATAAAGGRRRPRRPGRASAAPSTRTLSGTHPQRHGVATAPPSPTCGMRLDGGPRGVLRIRLGGSRCPAAACAWIAAR